MSNHLHHQPHLKVKTPRLHNKGRSPLRIRHPKIRWLAQPDLHSAHRDDHTV
jgi:hypothetical protein